MTKVTQFKNHLLSTCCVSDAMETKVSNVTFKGKEHNISALRGFTIQDKLDIRANTTIQNMIANIGNNTLGRMEEGAMALE